MLWLRRIAAVSALCAAAAIAQPQPIPNLTQAQAAELARIRQETAPLSDALVEARRTLSAVVFGETRNNAAIQAAVRSVADAEVALARAEKKVLDSLQASPNKLSAEQITAWISTGLPGGGGGRGGRGGQTYMTQRQQGRLVQMNNDLAGPTSAAAEARVSLRTAVFGGSIAASIQQRAEALRSAELALASARAAEFASIQASPLKLGADVVASLAAGNMVRPGGFTYPEPIEFNDHEGYVPLFDGVSLKGWDGNPKFWRVEGGAIVGESTPQNPSGNSYIAYRDIEAKDFTLKFEIKVEGSGGSGLQYRSKTGIPWLSPISPTVTANVGPVNLNWMMTGPQADFWPSSRDWTGQFYSENTPMRVLAWRGQVVEGAGMGSKRLMGVIGDRAALGTVTRMNDWNQYTVIARGGTFIHILNGQLMAVMIDDDPNSSNNQSGLFGIEIEATTKVFVRNIWLKKLN